jgi:hypothetical protein
LTSTSFEPAGRSVCDQLSPQHEPQAGIVILEFAHWIGMNASEVPKLARGMPE